LGRCAGRAPLRVAEVCGSGPDLLGLLGALGREAAGRGCGEVVIRAAPGGELEGLARRVGGRVTWAYARTGGGMARIVHWERCIEALAPLWAATPEVDLTLGTDLGGVRLTRGHAEVTDAIADIRLPQALLLQGLLGHLGGADLLADPRVELLRPAAADAFVGLLPRRAP